MQFSRFLRQLVAPFNWVPFAAALSVVFAFGSAAVARDRQDDVHAGMSAQKKK
jgi:hypothetical protein